jgi:hypothetical protein
MRHPNIALAITSIEAALKSDNFPQYLRIYFPEGTM